MTVTREQSVESRSGRTEEAIKGLVSRSIRELREQLTLTGELEATSNPKPVSVMTINEEIKSKKIQWYCKVLYFRLIREILHAILCYTYYIIVLFYSHDDKMNISAFPDNIRPLKPKHD